jgi:threonine/homoserine/homoserine lactone efflux protein
VVLFVLSNVVAKNASHPGTASQILWIAFLIGIVLLIVLGVVALVRARAGYGGTQLAN